MQLNNFTFLILKDGEQLEDDFTNQIIGFDTYENFLNIHLKDSDTKRLLKVYKELLGKIDKQEKIFDAITIIPLDTNDDELMDFHFVIDNKKPNHSLTFPEFHFNKRENELFEPVLSLKFKKCVVE